MLSWNNGNPPATGPTLNNTIPANNDTTHNLRVCESHSLTVGEITFESQQKSVMTDRNSPLVMPTENVSSFFSVFVLLYIYSRLCFHEETRNRVLLTEKRAVAHFFDKHPQ